LETEYGDDRFTNGGYRGYLKWRTGNGAIVTCSWIEEMDDLFGQVYPYNVTKDIIDMNLPMMGDYHVNWFMLTPNKPTEPSYKRNKIKRSLD